MAVPSVLPVAPSCSTSTAASSGARQVAQWVANLSPKLRPFAYNFEVHQIDGEVFLQLDNAMLTEIGINLVGAC